MTPIRVPEDSTLATALSTDQVHMVIVGSGDTAQKVATSAGQVADRQEFGSTSPRSAIWVDDESAAAADLQRFLGSGPYALVTVLDRNREVVARLNPGDGIDRIALEQAFLKGGA
jgi:hypothetical protein